MKDVIVVGGGPAGYAAAIRSSQLNAQVTIVEQADLGGTCVNLGCIPSKIWLRGAYLLHWLKKAPLFGIDVSVNGFDFSTLVKRKSATAAAIRMGMEGLLKNYGVERVKGTASLKNAHQVTVDGKTLEAKKIILATGSALDTPDIPGIAEAALTTDKIFDITAIPASALVLGGGPIEVEIATLLNIFGAKVTLATDANRILPREDHDTSQRISKSLREAGIEVLLRSSLQSVKKAKGAYLCVLSGPEEVKVEVEKIAVCSRKPNSTGMGLVSAGVELNEDGAVEVNDQLETSLPGVFAIGDVTGKWMLSHEASSMAIVAAENAMDAKKSYPFHLVPRGIWTIPEVGAVGLSEEEAEERGYDVKIGEFPFSINGLAMGRDEAEGSVKVVSDTRYGEILGVHIVGGRATDLIGEAVVAMSVEGTVEDLARGMRVHPTFSENVVDASRDAQDWALYLPKR